MNLFNIRQQIPATLAVINNFVGGKLKSRQVKDILSAIENFHFAFTAVTSQRSSGGISFMYAFTARNLNAAADPASRLAELAKLKEKLKAKRPSYAEFEPRFLEILYSTKYTKQRQLVRYILGRFLRAHSPGFAIDMDRMTIEHIEAENAPTKALDDEQTAAMETSYWSRRS